MINHKEYLDFLFKTGLTQAQFLLIYLVYKKDQKAIEKYKIRFPSDDGTMVGKSLTQQLIDEDWLYVTEGRTLVASNKFRKLFLAEADNAYLKELIEIYPAFYDKDGINIPLVTIDLYKYTEKYFKAILESFKEHNTVLKDLKWGVKHNYIRFGINKFIDAEMWTSLRKLRLKWEKHKEGSSEEEEGEVDLDMFDEDF